MRHLIQSFFMSIFVLIAVGSFARPATQEERAQIEARMEAFLDAMENERYDVVSDISIAPKVWLILSENMGLELEQLRPSIASQMSSIMEQFEMSNIEYDVSQIELQDSETLVYGFFPNQFDVTVGGETTHISNPVFALLDEGEWYILRIDPQQLPMLQNAYPELIDLTAPETLVTRTEELVE